MTRYRFDLAQPSDEAELRRVLAATPMPGKISVTLRRDPDFFAGSAVDGPFYQVGVCRDQTSRQVVGFGCRGVRDRYVNGTSQPIGYLSMLRLLTSHRNRSLVARGYAYLRQLHQDGRTRLYLTTIAEGNQQAITTLTSARAGLPAYHPAGNYLTMAIPIRSRRHRPGMSEIEIQPMMVEDTDDVIRWLNQVGRSRQFFPAYQALDCWSPSATFQALQPTDVLLARRSGQLVGCLGTWDQQRFRQTVVHHLSPLLRWWRPAHNALATIRRGPRLPRAGEAFQYVCGALPVVKDDDPHVWDALLNRQLDRLAASRHDYLLIGMHQADPLRPGVARRASATYATRLYYVCWPDGDALRRSLDGRVPYLELGCL